MTGNVPEVVHFSICNLQVCVPEEYTDAEAEEFADKNHPTGLAHGWKITDAANGGPRRNPCAERPGCVHILLVC